MRSIRGVAHVNFVNSISGLSIGSTFQLTNSIDLDRPPHRPMECPRSPVVLVDRDMERAELGRLCALGTEKGILYAGMPGVGRLSLIERWVEDHAGDIFPDGVLFLDYDDYRKESHCDLAAVMRNKLRALSGDDEYVAKIPDNELSNRYRTLTAGKRLLIILKNATMREEVERFIPGSSGSMLVATVSQGYTVSPDDDLILKTINPLSEQDSLNLYRVLMKQKGRDLGEVDKASLDELMRRCGGFPLAIRIAVDALCRDEDYIRRVTDQAIEDELFPSSKYDRIVREALKSCGASAELTFALLASFDISYITIPSLAALCGCSVKDAFVLARELEARSLVRLTQDVPQAHGGWGFKLELLAPVASVIRRSFLGKAECAGSCEHASERMASYLRSLCEDFDWGLKPVRLRTYTRSKNDFPIAKAYFEQGISGIAIIRREIGIIRHFLVDVWEPKTKFDCKVWPIGEALWSFYHGEHLYSLGIELLEACERATENEGGPCAAARNLLLRALLASKQGDFLRAQDMMALADGEIAHLCSGDDAFNLTMRSSVQEFWGGLETRRKNYDVAIQRYKSALAIIDEGIDRGHPMNRARFLSLTRMGNAHRFSGRYNMAKACYEQAIESTELVGKRSVVSAKLDYIDLLIMMKEYSCAFELASGLIEYFNQSDERYRKARCLLLIAKASCGMYEDNVAVSAAKNAKAYFEANGFAEEACSAQSILLKAGVTGFAHLYRCVHRYAGRFGRACRAVVQG